MYKYVVGISQNGHELYINLIRSAAGAYFSRHPYLIHIAKDVLAPSMPEGTIFNVAHDTGHNLGNTNIVSTSDKDTIYYAKPLRESYSCRFVKNRSLAPSSELAIVLKQDDDQNYEITDIWIGPLCPPFPNASNATIDSSDYWRTHALIADSIPVQSQSITSVCPY